MFKSRKVKRLEREVRALIKNAENARHREQAAMAMLSKYIESNRALQKGCRRLSRKVKRLREENELFYGTLQRVEREKTDLMRLHYGFPDDPAPNSSKLKFTVPAGVNGMEAE